MSNTLFTNFSPQQQIGIWLFLVLFSKKISFLLTKNTTLQEKVIIAEKELDWVDVEDIGNVEDLLRLMFLDEECENLKVVFDGGVLTRNINKKKKRVVLQAYRCALCDRC